MPEAGGLWKMVASVALCVIVMYQSRVPPGIYSVRNTGGLASA